MISALRRRRRRRCERLSRRWTPRRRRRSASIPDRHGRRRPPRRRRERRRRDRRRRNGRGLDARDGQRLLARCRRSPEGEYAPRRPPGPQSRRTRARSRGRAGPRAKAASGPFPAAHSPRRAMLFDIPDCRLPEGLAMPFPAANHPAADRAIVDAARRAVERNLHPVRGQGKAARQGRFRVGLGYIERPLHAILGTYESPLRSGGSSIPLRCREVTDFDGRSQYVARHRFRR